MVKAEGDAYIADKSDPGKLKLRFSDCEYNLTYEPVREKTNKLGSDQVRHKPACTVTEAGQKLESLDIRKRGSVLSV